MPLFEFSCLDCSKRFTFLSGVVADNAAPRCPVCQSVNLKKLMSKFSRGRSDDARMDAMGEKLEAQNFDDPRELRRFAREMGREMGAETGEDMSDEMEAMIEEEASGEGEMGEFGSAGGDDGTIY
ncbi:putative regulatory protein, FmdB family [Abditibacterium utsteinense]|uniref:Putative regulatory protein, FmdB family n=1 Tax=Abditibacterium utsteinense TaxID=1960156 RepID=A0A2S8SX39_9BACT|nr:zinc ribbon domain-containing protein [Abditibacterium utsteinense]PQV65367.1 putative regulatory protein, FmdB family [Abditibacterium utsteinense]